MIKKHKNGPISDRFLFDKLLTCNSSSENIGVDSVYHAVVVYVFQKGGKPLKNVV